MLPGIPAPATLQFNLRRAAKARIDRMVAEHPKRKELSAPEYVKNEWRQGDKNAMADLLQNVNFDRDLLDQNLCKHKKRIAYIRV